MSQDQEWLVRLQFLEEAQEYINSIESNLLGLSTQGVSPEGYNDILRAAHSLKGGSALMGFEELSQVAHRLEDFLKVLKAGHRADVVDASLEQLFFKVLDCMGQMAVLYRQRQPITTDWLAAYPNPFLDELYACLGDPLPEDDIADLSAEAGEDMVSLMFSSEVEPCLDRIEGILADAAMPLLKEEFVLACQEMAGLGEMLELPVFAGLCHQVAAALEEAEGECLVAIAQTSLKGLQRAQALVMMGEPQLLPQQLDLPLAPPTPAPPAIVPGQAPPESSIQTLPPDISESLAIEPSLVMEQGIAQDAVSPELIDSQLISSEPIASEFIVAEPIIAESLTAELVAPNDVVVKPTAVEPVAAEPTTPEPIAAEPIAAEFTTPEAVAPELVAAEPTTPENKELDSPEVSDFSPELRSSLANLDLSGFGGSDLGIEHLVDHGEFSHFQLDSTELQQLQNLAEEAPVEPVSESITGNPQPSEPEMPHEQYESMAQEAAIRLQTEDDMIDAAKKQQLNEQQEQQAETVLSSAEPSVLAPQSTTPQTSAPQTSAQPSTPPKVEDSTVRVAVTQLERLGEMVGELNTWRGGLDLRLGSLKSLMMLLNRRVQSLNTANEKLRESYDSTATLTPKLSGGHGPLPLAHSNVAHPNVGSAASNALELNQQFDRLEMDQYSDIHLMTQEIIERVVQIQEVSSDIELALGETEGISRELSRTSRQMQIGMTQVRMRPLSELTRKFPRLLRQLSLQHGKWVKLEERGTSTLIERSILEALQDPLMHLLRNCFDHGLESPDIRESQGKPREGTIEINASYRGNQTVIVIRDDGQGINLEKIKAKVISSMGLSREEIEACSEQEVLDLIFEPGFSTADSVTDLSGRGVGMDVVRSNLANIQGTIQVETRAGQGTTFTITVPLSISVTRVLVVECQGLVLAVPTSLVEEMLLLESQKIMTAAEQELLEWQGYTVPLLRLNQWLTFNRPPTQQETENTPIIDQAGALLVTHNNAPYAIHCDRYWGEQEVTTRLIEGSINLPSGFSGCVVLGDGRVAPLVETEALLSWIFEQQRQANGTQAQHPDRKMGQSLSRLNAKVESSVSVAPLQRFEEKSTVMIVDDSINVRRFLAITLEKSGYRIEQAKDGLDALQKLKDQIQVDAILSDVEMPRMDGFQFLATLQDMEDFRSIPVVMLTSRSGSKHRKLAKQLGAADYFAKPFKQNELLNRLAELTQSSTEGDNPLPIEATPTQKPDVSSPNAKANPHPQPLHLS